MPFDSPQPCYCGTKACKKIIGNKTQKTADQMFESAESLTEPSIEPPIANEQSRLSGYKIPKLNRVVHGVVPCEQVNRSKYSRDAAGLFRVESWNKSSRASKHSVSRQVYGKDSAGVYLLKDLKKKSHRSNQNSRTSTPVAYHVFSKSSHESDFAQNHRSQMLAAADAYCQRDKTNGHSSVSFYNFR